MGKRFANGEERGLGNTRWLRKQGPVEREKRGGDMLILEEQVLITESNVIPSLLPHPAPTLIQPSVTFTLLSVPADQIRASFKVGLFYLGYV